MKRRRKLSIALIILLVLMVFSTSTMFVSAESTDNSAVASGEESSDHGPEVSDELPATEATGGAAESAETDEPESLYPITATKKVLENTQYELYIDEKTANIRVVDKRTGTEWLGAPQVSRKTMPNIKKFIDSPVFVRYTEGADITQTYTLKDKETTVSIEIDSDTVRANFNLALIQISFALEYRLSDNGLEVTIPDDSIQEAGIARLTSLEVLPYLNAAMETDDGAIFLPDGSGALLTFRPNHPAYLRGYSEPIYGTDPLFIKYNHDYVDSVWRRINPNKESIALPVFGIYRNGIGVMGIVKAGEHDAKINGTPAGIRAINLYRTSVEFVYRKDDSVFIGTSGLIPYYQGRRIVGDRIVGYTLLSGKDADYIGMAKKYRDYLVQEKGVRPISQQQPRLSIELLGGLKREEIIGSTFMKMTTFKQAQTIIDQYSAKGITDIELTFTGWAKDGLYGDQPDHFPVEKKLGGSKDLKELISYAEGKGIALYLSANYVRPFAESDGISKRKDAVRGMDRELYHSFNYYASDRWNKSEEEFFLLKPSRVWDKHIVDEVDDFADLHVSGVHLDYMGNLIYSDQTKGDLLDRSETAAIWQQTLELFRDKVGQTAVDYGFAYTLGLVDRINNTPLDSSHFIYTDVTVPFYQIALHGLIPYYAAPINLMDNPIDQKLRMVGYGALPSFELTYGKTSDLQRTMEDRLFSSDYRDWLNEVIEEHDRLSQLYTHIDNSLIDDYRLLQDGVYKTSYDNGVQVYVNYGESDVTVEGVAVQAKSYSVKGGAAH